MSTVMLVLVSIAAALRPPYVFGDARGWVFLDDDGRVLKRLSHVCGMLPTDVAAAPDLRTIVFTAWSDEAQNSLLYACDADGKEARRLGEASGYHAQPAFSADGAWVFFVHHPRKGGPPGTHEPGANAQLYRVRANGSELEAMSDSRGCKLSPRSVDEEHILLLHLSCLGERAIELMRLQDRVVVASWADGQLSHYPDLAPGGRMLVYTLQKYDAVELTVVDTKTRRSRLLWSLPAGYETTRARWTRDARAVLFQQGDVVWKVSVSEKPVAQRIAGWGESQ